MGKAQMGVAPCSEETAKIIDAGVKRIIDDQYPIALKIQKETRDLLDRSAVRLPTDGLIDGKGLAALSKAVKFKPSPNEMNKSEKRNMAA